MEIINPATFDLKRYVGPDAPPLDLGLAQFEKKVTKYLEAFDERLGVAHREIAQRAQEYDQNIAHVKQERNMMEIQIKEEEQNEKDMLQAIEVERRTVGDLQTSLSRFQASLQRVRDQNAALDGQIMSLKTELGAERATKERQAKVLADMRERDARQLAVLEGALGLRMEGVGDDRLLLLFTLIDPSSPEREFRLVLDFAGGQYSVPQCDPPLANLGTLLEQVNSDRDVHLFIKKVRREFAQLVPKEGGKFDDLELRRKSIRKSVLSEH